MDRLQSRLPKGKDGGIIVRDETAARGVLVVLLGEIGTVYFILQCM